MYLHDVTIISLGNLQDKIKVTSGIRQGCSISTLLFKMVTLCIIEEMEEKGVLYEVDRFKGNSLWLADDTILFANSIENMETNIKVLKEAAIKYGLEVNEGKSKVIQIRGKDKPKKIGNCEVLTEVQYLGIKVGGRGRNIYGLEKEEMNSKSKRTGSPADSTW